MKGENQKGTSLHQSGKEVQRDMGTTRRTARSNTSPSQSLRLDVMIIVAGFGIDAAFRDPGSIDPDRGSGTQLDRRDSFVGRDPVRCGCFL
jgi:hypothetical protein